MAKKDDGKNPFDELLASIPDEGDRQAFNGLAEKYDFLRDGYMTRPDYSRKMDALTQEKKALEAEKEWVDYGKKQREWWQENWVPDAFGKGLGATKRELELKSAAEAAAKEAEELKGKIGVGEEVTFAELQNAIDNRLATAGYVDRKTFQETVDTNVKSVNEVVGKLTQGSLHVALTVPILAQEHREKFGEKLDTQALWEFATKNGYGNLNEAYERFTGDREKDLVEKRHREEIEAAKKAVEAETIKRLQAEQRGGSNSITDDRGPEMGHLQRKVTGQETEEDKQMADAIKGPLGNGARAAYYVQKMRSEQRGSV